MSPRAKPGSVLFLAAKSVWNEMRPPLSFRWLGPSRGDFFHAAFLARRCALCVYPGLERQKWQRCSILDRGIVLGSQGRRDNPFLMSTVAQGLK